MLFDPQKYLRRTQLSLMVPQLEMPSNRVPQLNLGKLSSDKKIAVVKVQYKVSKDLIVKDSFEWDLNNEDLTPYAFAKDIYTALGHQDQQLIKTLANDIADQLLEHIDNNTFFPRQRLTKQEQEMVAQGLVCVNCESLLPPTGQQICPNCGAMYDKKTMERRYRDIEFALRVGAPPQDINKRAAQGVQVPVTERQKQIGRSKNSLLDTSGFLDPRLHPKYCRNCEIKLPFFYFKCFNCDTQFVRRVFICDKPVEERYSLYFWDTLLREEELLETLEKVTPYLEEDSFDSVRHLYEDIMALILSEDEAALEHYMEKMKSPEIEPEPEVKKDVKMKPKKRGRKPKQEVMKQLEEKKLQQQKLRENPFLIVNRVYDQVLSINQTTDKIFREMMYLKTKKLSNMQLDFKKLRLGLERGNLKGFDVGAAQPVKVRPSLHQNINVQNCMHNLQILGSMNSSIAQTWDIKKRGRPKKYQIFTQEMLDKPELIDRSVLLMPGQQERKEPKRKERKMEFFEDSELMMQSEESQTDLNFSWCGKCGEKGDLLCCEFCPAAFHIECLGLQFVPKHQWKCYFCKVVMNGINEARPAVKEDPLCLKLNYIVPTWKHRAVQLLDVLQQYQACHEFKQTPANRRSARGKLYLSVLKKQLQEDLEINYKEDSQPEKEGESEGYDEMEELKEQFQMKRRPVKVEKKSQKGPQKPLHFETVEAFLEQLAKVWNIRGGQLEKFSGEVCENLVHALISDEKIMEVNVGQKKKEEEQNQCQQESEDSIISETSLQMSIIDELEESQEIRKLTECYTPSQIKRKLNRGKTSLLSGRKKGRTCRDRVLYEKFMEAKKKRYQ